MGLPEEEQTRLYNNYWSKLEMLFLEAGSAPDSFLRDYIALKKKTTIQTRADNIYVEFKDFWRSSSEVKHLDTLLEDMVRFARYYVFFLRPERIDSKPLVTAMQQVHLGGSSTHVLLIMRLYECYEKSVLSYDDFIRSLNLIASYLVRRTVLGLQTRSYWSVFARIAHSISDESSFESFQVALARQNFPSDESFMQEIRDRDLYGLRICWYILTQLENAGQGEPSPTHEYSIEHIMPDSIDDVPEWQEMLGDKWENVHQAWLHRLGNLTLTAYNSAYSNRSFNEKKTIEGGFNQSAVRLNEYVRNQTQWTESEMEERGRILAKRAVEIWPHHQADEKLILDEEIQELRARADERNSDSLEMSDSVRELLHAIRDSIREMGDAIAIIENKSVCYYNNSAKFFAEILPMAYYVRLLIPLDFDEIHDPEGLSDDATTWHFLPNVTHRDCGVLIDIQEKQQIAAVMQMVRQAFSMAES